MVHCVVNSQELEVGTAIGETASNQADKQAYLVAAISDISGYIQFSDAKVSIVMGATVALIAGLLASSDRIVEIVEAAGNGSSVAILITVLFTLFICSILFVFAFGISTISNHVPRVPLATKWFVQGPFAECQFEKYCNSVLNMNDEDIIREMCAELFKLNDINQQKGYSVRWTLRSFALSMILLLFMVITVMVGVL